MATKHTDALDDELVADGNTSFAGGQVSATPPENVPANAYSQAQNMDFDQFGRLRTRRGARTTTGNVLGTLWDAITDTWDGTTAYWGSTLGAQNIRGAFYFDTGSDERIILEQNNELLSGGEAAAYGAISGSAIDAAAKRPYFAQLGTRLYYCDGVNALKYVDSAAANQTITAGKVTSIKITEPGSGYDSAPAITFTHNGGSSGAATAILGYGGRVVGATVTTAGSGYSATTPPTIAFAAGDVTAEGRVNISQVPSKPQFLVAHTGRLFCASADTGIPADTLYVSDILDGESWDLAGNNIRVGGDGDPITGLFPWFDNYLVVFKERSIHIVDCDPAKEVANWTVRLVTGGVGCVSHYTAQPVGKDVFFLSADGVRTLSQIESGSQNTVGNPISVEVQDELDNINRSYLYKATAVYHNNRYFLSFPYDSSTYNNRTVVYNALAGKWVGVWTNWSPSCYCVTNFGGKRRLSFGDYSGRFWTWDDFTGTDSETVSQYRDDATDYESYVVTRGYTCNDPLVDKLGYVLSVMLENRLSDVDLDAYLSYDRDNTGTFTSLDSSINVPAGSGNTRYHFNLLSYGKWASVQFKIGTTSGKLAVNAVALTGFPDTITPEMP